MITSLVMLACCALSEADVDDVTDFAEFIGQDRILVFEEKNLFPDQTASTVAACRAWGRVIEIPFESAQNAKEADIIVTYAGGKEIPFRFRKKNVVGHTTWHGQKVVYLNSTLKERLAEHLLAVMLHEIGHAIGLRHHSADPADVMNAIPRRSTLSANDARRARTLYSLEGGQDARTQSPDESGTTR